MHTKKQESKQEQPLQNMTLEQAEKIILEQLKAKKNMKDIVKMKFLIDGVETGFNINKIGQIKEKHMPKINLDHRDLDKAVCFKFFKRGFSPSDVVIKTNLSPDFVQKGYQEFLEFEGNQVVDKKTIQDLFNLGSTYAPCNNLQDLSGVLNVVIPNAKLFSKLQVGCLGCGELMYIDEVLIESARKHLEKHWRHTNCWENKLE